MAKAKANFKCSECQGLGYIETKRNANESVVLKCSRCNGKGVIKVERPILHESIVGDDYSLTYHES
jgi:DnaJ-class molecular chaperone|tara:strand:- start:2323 stop:2520 length:198 start_codon:yes stop_codon:yes gene_type:complete